MVFSNVLFPFVFLPVCILLYYISKDSYKNIILLFASLCFYAIGEPQYIFLMFLSIIVNYTLAIGIEDKAKYKKHILLLALIYNIGLLFVFKYLGFAIRIFNKLPLVHLKSTSFPLPLGISFYTFQSLSYCLDVYKGEAKAQRNIINLSLYVSLFPQLIAGPIVRYNSLESQILYRNLNLECFGKGIKRFVVGLCKKVLLANNLAIVAEYYFSHSPTSLIGNWLGAVCFSLQIYYDFAGYSDMAIGLGRIFGFSFEENFNYPYIAYSITDFWRRWHISLSRWFRDYVYIPLGGSRVKASRHIINMAARSGLVLYSMGIYVFCRPSHRKIHNQNRKQKYRF